MFFLFFLFSCDLFSSHPKVSSQKTSLPLPRFACLKSKKINVHVGPGYHYPVVYQYVRQFFPVEIVAEFDLWRKIRDYFGNE
jgi:SH3-like domain-containing protein